MTSKEPIGSSPLAHARWLHGSRKGYVTVGQKPDREPWVQDSYPVQKLYEVVPIYGGLNDVYISQNRFRGSRRTDRITELSAMYSDVDYYKIPDLANLPATEALYLAFEALEQAKIPHPSLAMFTGRGLALVWRHHPVQGNAISRWNRCQQTIFEALKQLGADPMAKSVPQVLRLAGTYNSESGRLVESILENLDEVWEFGDLADKILPLTREQWEQHRARLLAQRAEKDGARGPRTASEGQRDGRKGFGSRELHKARLNDLERLLELRGMDKLPPGKRDDWMFVAGCSMSFLMGLEALEKELIALGWKRAGWGEAETRSRMHSIISRANSASGGEMVPWNGQRRDTRYRLTNETIIQILEITPEEQKDLETIVSGERKQEIRRQRDRERKEQKRRSEGVVPRKEYLAKSRDNRPHHRTLAKELKARGMSLRRIGSELGKSHTYVRELLNSEE